MNSARERTAVHMSRLTLAPYIVLLAYIILYMSGVKTKI